MKLKRFFDQLFDWVFIDFRRILGPTWRQVGFLNPSGDFFFGVLVPLGAKMASRPPQECHKTKFWTNFHKFELVFRGFVYGLWYIFDECFVGLLACWLVGLLLVSCYPVPGTVARTRLRTGHTTTYTYVHVYIYIHISLSATVHLWHEVECTKVTNW